MVSEKVKEEKESKKNENQGREGTSKIGKLKYFIAIVLVAVVAIVAVSLFVKNKAGISGEVVKDNDLVNIPSPSASIQIKADEVISSTEWVSDDTEIYFLCKLESEAEKQEACNLLNEIKCQVFCKNSFSKSDSEVLSRDCNFACEIKGAEDRITGTAVCRCN